MTTISPAWWCPECKNPVQQYGRPCECGHPYMPTWKCSQCGRISTDFDCTCGFDRAKAIRNRELERHLSKRILGTNQTILERLYKHIRFHGFNRQIPSWVIEEAWCSALERLVNGIGDYNPDKGKFLHWAFAVVRNELYNTARSDVQEASHTRFSIDYERESDNSGDLLIEALGTGDSALDTVISKEERTLRFLSMRELALTHLGTYGVVEGGILMQKSVYLACLKAYDQVGKHGWIKTASEMTGVPEYTIIRRKDAIREAWGQWQKEEFET